MMKGCRGYLYVTTSLGRTEAVAALAVFGRLSDSESMGQEAAQQSAAKNQ